MSEHSDGRTADRLRSGDSRIWPWPGSAQRNSAVPAALNPASKPIGKVVVATGSVTVERTGARVIQASVDAQAGQAKVGDVVYEGDVVATGADGRVGINFTDGTAFNLSSNARMAFQRVRLRPERNVQQDLAQSDQGNLHVCCRQGRDDWRYEDRYPRRDIRDSSTTPHVEISMTGTFKFSTLIEEGKSRVARNSVRSAAPQSEPTRPASNLKICRGC